MNDIKRALDSGMKNIHFNQQLVLDSVTFYHKRYMVKKTITAAAIALFIVCMNSEVAQSAFAHMYHSIANIMGKNEKVEEYTTIIGQSVTDNGITVTLSDAIVSEEKLILSLDFSTGKELGYKGSEVYWGDDIKVYMDGIEMPVAGMKGTGNLLDEYTFNNILEYYIGYINSNEKHSFVIEITKISNKDQDTSGNWTFAFTASGEAMATDTKVMFLDDSLSYNNCDIIFEKYVANSYEKLLYVSYSDGTGYPDRGNEFELVGYDDLGNVVWLYAEGDYYNKNRTIFTCLEGTDISEEASILTLQIDEEWPYEFDSLKESVTINVK